MIGLCLFTISIFGPVLPVSADTGSAGEAKIHVDQVGYLSEYPKVAIIAATGTDVFKIVAADTNAVVYTGTLSASRNDPASGETVRSADFSPVTAPGSYKVVIDGLGSSYTFKIDNNIYYIPLIHTLRSYTLGRSNATLNDSVTGLTHAATHTQDKVAKVFFSDKISTKGQVLDVSGGWYDAGDFGKYVATGGGTVANILLAYEAQPEKFKKGQMFFPEGIPSADMASDMPDVLVEMKYELDWMMKMQRPDGSVFHKVAGAYWPGLNVNPLEDTQDRYIYGVSTYGTAICGATFALAARSYEKYDPQYAAKLLELSKKAFAFLENNSDPIYRVDVDQDKGSGAYDKKTDVEDRIWIAAELFKTTGDKYYENYLKKNFSNQLTAEPDMFGWLNTFAFGQWAYITSKNADDSLRDKAKEAFLGYADKTVKQIAQDGYNCSLKINEYTWASTKNAVTKADMLLMANQLNPKQDYVNGALDQIHYLFGRNANGISYMTGEGTKPVQHPHNRIHESTGIYVPGLVVGGPNNWPGGDTLQAKLIASGKIPPAKAYLDERESYSTNEYAIDYTSPATYALAYFSVPNDKITGKDLKIKSQNANTAVSMEKVNANQSGNKAKGKGSIDKNYISYFENITPYKDGASTIKATMAKKVLTVEYKLEKNGWMGVPTGQLMEDWSTFTGIQITVADGTGNKIRIELVDGNGVSYENIIVDDAVQGKLVTIPFSEFKVRRDWQPAGVDTNKSFSLNPVLSLGISPLEGKGKISFSNFNIYK